MNSFVITGGRIIDPSEGVDRIGNLLVEDGKIAAYDVQPNGQTVIDATGKIVSPGLIDIHAELREPGYEEDETIATGTAAAVAGGFTTVACIPSTDPPVDTQAGVEFIKHQTERAGNCNVVVLASVSKGREGKELAELGSLVEAGAVGFTDAARSIENTDLLRRALQYCLMFDKPILNHPEVTELSHSGVMHEGLTSMILGLSAIPAEAEDVMTARDIRLAEATGGRLHLMNISTSGSVEVLRRAKSRGVGVTAEVTAAHLSLTDESLRSFDTNLKLNPPLRSRDHIDACIEGLKDGTIDVIVSGHAPRAAEKKMLDLDLAPYGMSSLETALALVITNLIEPGHLDWPDAVSKLSTNPAQVLSLDKGTLRIGSDADITIIDPESLWTVDPRRFRSKSGNTPLEGRVLKGGCWKTIVRGQVKYSANESLGRTSTS